MCEPLVFRVVDEKDIVKGQRYLANVKPEGLVFGCFGEDGKFYNEGYGYFDAQEWKKDEVVALYAIPEEVQVK